MYARFEEWNVTYVSPCIDLNNKLLFKNALFKKLIKERSQHISLRINKSLV